MHGAVANGIANTNLPTNISTDSTKFIDVAGRYYYHQYCYCCYHYDMIYLRAVKN